MTAAPTHYCQWDAPGKHKVQALCGAWMRRREHTNAPTCPRCQDELGERHDRTLVCACGDHTTNPSGRCDTCELLDRRGSEA